MQKEGTNSLVDLEKQWTLHVGSLLSSSRSSIGLILARSDVEVMEYALRLGFPTTNNKALLVGLKIVKELGVGHLIIFSDS